jgi:hypothetical protein
MQKLGILAAAALAPLALVAAVLTAGPAVAQVDSPAANCATGHADCMGKAAGDDCTQKAGDPPNNGYCSMRSDLLYCYCLLKPKTVGGIAELPDMAGGVGGQSAWAGGSSSPPYAAIAGAAAVGALAFTAGARYARRRWLG